MSDSTFMGKIVLILGAFSVFLLLSTGVELTGWNDFTLFVSSDPFADVPQWPDFGQPAVNITTGNLFLRDTPYTPYDDDIECDNTMTLSLSAGASVQTVVLSPDESACWTYPVSEISFNAGLWNRTLWLSTGTLTNRITSTLHNVDSQSWAWFPEHFCAVTTTITVSPFGYGIECTLGSWSFASNRVLVLTVVAALINVGTVTVSFNDPTVESEIVPPTWTSSSDSECSWNPITWSGCVVGTIEWTGVGILYLGGIAWVLLNYIGFAIAWILGLMISFFGAMISMLVLMVSGAGVPPPASYIFQVTFISLLSFIVFTILSLILGRASNTG